jgi:uncharacterized protein (TIGR03437 family)
VLARDSQTKALNPGVFKGIGSESYDKVVLAHFSTNGADISYMRTSTLRKTRLLDGHLIAIVLWLAFCRTLPAQSSLVLGSGSGTAGAAIALNLTITSVAGSEPAGIQWMLGYSTGVTSISIVPGNALIAANKTLTCAPVQGGQTCIAVGMNETTISNGIAATVLVQLAANVPVATLTLSNGLGATWNGNAIAMSVTGGTAQAAVRVMSVSCSQTSLNPTDTSICTVSLSGTAGPSGVTVGITSSTPDLVVPSSVVIPAASSSGTFVATAAYAGSNESATISTTLNGSATATIALMPIVVTGLQCGSSTLASNATTLCTVSISRPAPSSGTVVVLSDSASINLTVPPTVTVPLNTTSAVFGASTGVLSGSSVVNLGAAFGSSSATFALTAAAGPVSLVCSPIPMPPGQSGTCTVAMAGAGSVTKNITLHSSNSAYAVPASVTVPSGSSNAPFTYTITPTISGQVTLSATAENVTGSLLITVPDRIPPVISFTAPAKYATVSGLVAVNVNATDNVGVVGVELTVDGVGVGGFQQVAGSVYTVTWNSQAAANAGHTLGAVANDAAGNTATASISINLQNAPTFSGVGIGAFTSSSATIAWITNETSNSQVVYGPSVAYGSVSGINKTMVTSHSVTLNGLAPSTMYHYQVQSADGWGNPGSSADFTFTTGPALQTLLQMHLDGTEVSSVKNGSMVTPSTSPAGFAGTVVVNGNGSVNFAPAESGDGVYFQNCCVNGNNAYYKFTGTAIGNVFDVNQGQITFYLKSRYTFAQRQASASQARYAFDVRDGDGKELFCFLIQVVSGRLVFDYLAAGSGTYYYVPTGSEDSLFGNGVILSVSISWGATGANLFLNNTLISSTIMATPMANWTASSIFNLGALQYLTFGGYDTIDDIVDEYTVMGEPIRPVNPLSTDVRTTPVNNGARSRNAAAQRPYGRRPVSSSASGVTSSRTVASEPAKPVALSCPGEARTSQRVICEVVLDRPAPDNSVAISLVSDLDSLQVPSSIGARSGQRAIRFEVAVTGVTSQTTGHIMATAGDSVVQTGLTLVPWGSPESRGANAKDGTGVSSQTGSADPPFEDPMEADNDIAGQPVILSVENGANRTAIARCSPGSIATLTGQHLYTAGLPAWNYAGTARELKGTRVLVNGVPMPLLYASAQYASFVCPELAPGTLLQIAVETLAGRSNTRDSQMVEVAPGLFTVNGAETSNVVATAAGSDDLSQLPGVQEPGNPVRPGAPLIVLATGFPCDEVFRKRLFVKVDEQYVTIESLHKVDQYAGACEIAIHAPNLSGDALPIMVEATRADGKGVVSNIATFAAVKEE